MSNTRLITSLDIGIHNLAYCTLEYQPTQINGNQFKIHQWNVIDLLQDEEKPTGKKTGPCTCHVTYGSGVRKGKKCDNLPYYLITEDLDDLKRYSSASAPPLYVCRTHSGKYQKSQLKRLYTTKNTSLCELACLMVKALDQVDFSLSQEIILESQPSKNPRMKNLSMMLFDYFVIRYMAEKDESTRQLEDVHFVSSHGKLTVYDGPYIECHIKNQHSRNKFYGKAYCQYLIRYNTEKLAFFNGFKKRDDLADSFLQGAWYLINGYKGPRKSPVHDGELVHHTLVDDPEPDIPNDPKDMINKKTPLIKLVFKTPIHPSPPQTSPTEQVVPKINIKLKPKLVGKELLEHIKTSDTTQKIRIDYNLNRYHQIKRGVRPHTDARRYTLSNIKYIVDHHQYDPSNSRLNRSLQFFFGETWEIILGLKSV